MNDFLLFFNDKVKSFPLHLEICYSKTCDWTIYVYKKGCADDYPKSERCNQDCVIVNEHSVDLQLCFAKAQVALKEWLLENEGGY